MVHERWWWRKKLKQLAFCSGTAKESLRNDLWTKENACWMKMKIFFHQTLKTYRYFYQKNNWDEK
jgi:hypothetical protein